MGMSRKRDTILGGSRRVGVDKTSIRRRGGKGEHLTKVSRVGAYYGDSSYCHGSALYVPSS